MNYDKFSAFNKITASGCRLQTHAKDGEQLSVPIIWLPEKGPGIKSWGAIDYLNKHFIFRVKRG